MAHINSRIKNLKCVLTLVASSRTCEKARVPAVKAEATRLFNSSYKEFMSFMTISNSFEVECDNHDEYVILVAEAAFAVELYTISRTVLEGFLQGSPQKGQFFCRAKLLMGLLIDFEARHTEGAESVRQRKLAVAEILKAVEVAMSSDNLNRYKFIIFNASITLWQIVSPFFRESRAHFFVHEVNQVSVALESIDDNDILWRISYLSAAAVCFSDDKQGKLASDALDKAIQHAEKLLGTVQSVDTALVGEMREATTESEQILGAIRRREDWEAFKLKKPRIDPDLPEGMQEVPLVAPPPLEGLAAKDFDELKALLDVSQGKKTLAEEKLRENNLARASRQELVSRLYMQRVHVNPADGKRLVGVPTVTQSLRMKTLVQLQCISSGCITDKEWTTTFAQMERELDAAPLTPAIVETMIDVSRAAWNLDPVCKSTAMKYLEFVEKCPMTSTAISIKLDICKALRMVADIADTSANKAMQQRLTAKEADGYAVSQRIEAIKTLERTIIMSARLDDSALVEEICVTLWNSAMPLLQSHLRKHVHQALQLATAALEAIPSTLVVLRSQMHFELAKCEEQSDFVASAKDHAAKSLSMDYGHVEEDQVKLAPGVVAGAGLEIDYNRPKDHLIRPSFNALDLRTNVYGVPPDVESKVVLILQQVKESSSPAFQTDMLLKATTAMIQELSSNDSRNGGVSRASTGTFSIVDVKPNVPEVPLEVLEAAVVQTRGVIAAPATVKGQPCPPTPPAVTYDTFTRLTQTRVDIMSSIARLSNAKQQISMVQQSTSFVLSKVWNPSDPLLRCLIDAQIDAHYLLAESLVGQLALLTTRKLSPWEVTMSSTAAGHSSAPADTRALGLAGEGEDLASDAARIKRLVVLCLLHGMQLSRLIGNQYGAQNAIIYFWNMHMHVFRKDLHQHAIAEVAEFVTAALPVIESFQQQGGGGGVAVVAAAAPQVPILEFDERLRISIVEAMACFMTARDEAGAAQSAGELAVKNCLGAASGGISGIYIRKRLAEQACKCLLTAAATVPADTKGAKGVKPFEPPKFDHAILNVFGSLTQAENSPPDTPKDQLVALVDKALGFMHGEVTAFISGLDVGNLTQENYDQILELMAEAWTRLTRLQILVGNTHGAQETAEKCMGLVADGLVLEHSGPNAAGGGEANKLSPRVWRWVSVCERYFGLAISHIIQPEGQDMALQNELRLASLRHLTLATNYAQRAKKDDLVLEAASDAWNVSLPLVPVKQASVRRSLFGLQRQIVDNILACSRDSDLAASLRQQFYLAMIDEQSQDEKWDAAYVTVQEAFDRTPSALQKPLWKWRVIVMSKLGKNVLDGIQKLKENDPSLQARVYAILARSSTTAKQQLDGYRKIVEILGPSLERVDYLLETAQWMGSAGIFRSEIQGVLTSALGTLYAVEESQMAPTQPRPNSANEVNSRQTKDVSVTSAHSLQSSVTALRTKAMSKSRGGASIATPSSQVESEIDSLLKPLSAKRLEQAARCLYMLAVVEIEATVRVEKCVEAMYFLQRFHGVWQARLVEAYTAVEYSKLSPEQQAELPYDQYKLSPEIMTALTIPQEPLALLCWVPSDVITAAMEPAAARSPLHVPSAESLTALPLTCHYIIWAADALDELGYPVYALYCLGWLRSVLWFISSHTLPDKEAVLLQAHFKAMSVLAKNGLVEESNRLPLTVGGSGQHCIDSVVAMIARQVHSDGGSAKALVGATTAAPQNMFGFFTWTLSFNTSVDVESCALSIGEDLLTLGMASQCQRLALALRVSFCISNNSRGILRTTSLLARIDMTAGRYKDALSLLLAAKISLRACGDPVQLAQQTVLAMRCYTHTGSYEHATRIGTEVLDLLEEYTHFAPDPTAAAADDGKLQRVPSARTLPSQRSQAVSRLSSDTRGSQKKASDFGPSSAAAVEASLECAKALADVAAEYADVLLAEAHYAMSSLADEARGADPRSFYHSLLDRLSSLHSTVVSAVGGDSPVSAALLEKRSVAAHTLLSMIHSYSSKGIPLDIYSRWLEDNYVFALETLQQAVNIRRDLLDRVPLSQRKLRVPMDLEGGGATSATTKLLSLGCMRTLALMKLQLASQHIWLAILRGNIRSGRGLTLPRARMSVVDRFLVDSKQKDDYVVEDFNTDAALSATMLVSAAKQLLKSTVHEKIGDVAFNIGVVLRFSAAGEFDSAWLRKSDYENMGVDPAAVARGEAVGDGSEFSWLVVTEAASAARDSLSVATATALKAGSSSSSSSSVSRVSVLEGVSTLVESFGSDPDGGNKAAAWLLQLQGMAAREWLLSCLKQTMNPASEVAAAMSRLEALENCVWPTAEAQRQVAVERRYLSSVSAAWRRLSVETDPSAILTAVPTTNTCYLCLQLCPRQKTLYVCAGVVPPGHTAAEAYCLPGKWAIDKIPLSEETRRLIQTLREQHLDWADDVTKFVATYCDSMSADMDIEGWESNNGDKSLGRREIALEERLRALLSDMEMILAPLLGEGTPLQTFIRSAVGDMSSAAGAGAGAGTAAKLGSPTLLLLLDPFLQDLPWEGLQVCQDYFNGRTSRDFSLHLLGHRVASLSTTPGAAISVFSSVVRTAVDPFGDDVGCTLKDAERVSMKAVTAELIKSSPGGTKWAPVSSSDGFVSLQDWVTAAKHGSKAKPAAIFSYVPCKISCFLNPGELATFNFENVGFLFVADLGQNDSSYRRQNSIDNLKSLREVRLESPLRVLALASLAGVGTLVGSRWSTTFASQARFVKEFWVGFTSRQESVTAALGSASVAKAGYNATVAESSSAKKSASAGPGDSTSNEIRPMKRWVRLSRFCLGVGFLSYVDG